MDFFGEQDRARQHSIILLALFFTAMIGFGLVIYAAASAVSLLLSSSIDNEWKMRISLVVTGLLYGVILYGCWRRYKDVKAGGRVLAVRFGGVMINDNSPDKAERQLLDIVAEMCVAASIPAPTTFCLKSESSINAFVVGSGDDMALVVSQGAIDNLDRDELLGVVGHEFGHIANGDLGYNMRLLVVLGGLNALSEAGLKTIHASADMGGKSRLVQNAPSSISIGSMLAGLLLCALGSIGVLAGSVIRASFSRQREFLADASSVQYTRSTYGLASALERIKQSSRGPAIHSDYRQELAHLCFQMPTHHFFFGRFLNTHPPIAHRIKAIDKHFAVKSRQRKAKEERRSSATNGSASGASAPITGGSGLPNDILALTNDPISSQAILFALFVQPNSTKRESFYSALRFAYDDSFSIKVKNMVGAHGEDIVSHRLRIIDIILPTLARADDKTRQVLLSNLEKLVGIEGKSIENVAALQLVRLRLSPTLSNTSDSTPNDTGEGQVKAQSISELGCELSLLLSLMVEASGYSGERVTDEYARVLRCYTSEEYPIRSVSENGVMEEMQRAFLALQNQPLLQRRAFVQHCVEIMQLDGINMDEELALLNLFAVSLDVPDLAVA